MARNLLFGTFNPNKTKEAQDILGEDFVVKSCADFPEMKEAVESEGTLQGNARIKAESYAGQSGLPCFSDDTGLEIDALNGRPGAFSARYADLSGDPVKNMARVLSEMSAAEDRSARFRTVIAYANGEGETLLFEGVLEGRIAEMPAGRGGFGYDPIFIPEGEDRTLAELSREEKNQISHRKKAMDAFLNHLKSL